MFLFTFAACSQSGQKSKVEVTTSFAFGGANMAAKAEGGLMVWGMSDKGHSFGRVLEDTDAILGLELPNATWTFTAVAWDDTDTSVRTFDSDVMRCARSLPIKLEGGQEAISLTLDQPTCETPAFKGSATSAEVPLRLRTCASLAGVSTSSHMCSNDLANPNRVSDKAAVMSVKVRMPSFDDFGTRLDIRSNAIYRCVPFPANFEGEWSIPAGLALPSGDPANPGQSPFLVQFEFFADSLDCGNSVAEPATAVTLKNGFVTNASEAKFFPGSSEHLLYLAVTDEKICSNNGALTPFAGGDGSAHHPMLICNANQLYAVHAAAANMGHSYRLLADIDLNPYSRGSSNTAGLPDNALHVTGGWEIGQNWQPIGTYYESDGDFQFYATPFSGHFFGGNYTIKNMRMRLDDVIGVGFIGEWRPASGERIRDLKFENAEVSGLAKVGTLLGFSSQTMHADVSNIEVSGSELEARTMAGNDSFLGGVVGLSFKLNAKDIRVKMTKVEGDGDRVGGVFGALEEAEQVVQVFSHSIVSSRNGAEHGGVAGIVYTTLAGQDFSEWGHEGVIVSGGMSVGGLAGVFQRSNEGIVDSYATTAIRAYGVSSNVGGLFGELNIPASKLARAYFAGQIDAPGASNRGRVAGTNATAQSSSELYYVDANILLVGFGDNSISNLAAKTNESVGIYASPLSVTFNTAPWIHTPGALPRLLSEEHPCALSDNALSLALQATTLARGTATNPLIVCNKFQFQEISGLTGTRYVKLSAAIHLGGSYTPISIASGVTVDGEDGLVMGYYNSSLLTAVNQSRAPIITNAGTLKNLRAANNKTWVLDDGNDFGGAKLAGLVISNTGLMKGIRLLSGYVGSQEFEGTAQLAGGVHSNEGVIEDMKSFVEIFAREHIGGLVYENKGTLSKIEVGGLINLIPINAGPLTNIAGVVHTNAGTSTKTATLSQVKVGLRLIADEDLDMISFVAIDNNQYADIKDVYVTSENRWQTSGAIDGAAQIVRTNDGEVVRSYALGNLLTSDNATSVTSDVELGQAIFAGDAGIGLITGVPSGRLIKEGTTFTCANTSELTVGTTGGAFTSGGSFWGTDGNLTDTDLLDTSKYVFAVSEQNGKYRVLNATSSNHTGSTLTLKLDGNCMSDFVGAGQNVSIIQAYANTATLAFGNPNGDAFSGLIYPQNASFGSFTPAGSPWIGKLLNEDDSEDLLSLVNYYLAVMSGQIPTPPGVWSIGSGEELGFIDRD
jgi:hypothetical protein